MASKQEVLEAELKAHFLEVKELRAAAKGDVEVVKIAFISDTHNMHRSFEAKCFDEVDILIHAGDMTNEGTDEEFKDFNEWLGELQEKFPKLRGNIYCVTGNHEMTTAAKLVGTPEVSELENDKYFKDRLQNAIFLDHGVTREARPGLCLAGVPWCPWDNWRKPDNVTDDEKKANLAKIWEEQKKHFVAKIEKPHRHEEIPEGVHILVQHMPIYGILDSAAHTRKPWGSSAASREVVGGKIVPFAVLHGHVHEQNGCFARALDGSWTAGPGVCFPPDKHGWESVGKIKCEPPPPDFGVCEGSLMQMIVNGANSNVPFHDKKGAHICMEPRIIFARRVARADGTKPGKWILFLK